MFDRGNGDLHDERIATGAAVTFEHLVRLLRYLDYVTVIDTADAHADECRYGQTHSGSIDLGAIPGNDSGILKLLHSRNNSRCRQPNTAAKLGKANAGI